MTPSIPILRNEINVLEDFRGGVKVARDFALRSSGRPRPTRISDPNTLSARQTNRCKGIRYLALPGLLQEIGH